MKNLESFLKPTKYCDFLDDSIQKIIPSIIGSSTDKTEIAVKLFYWVRDNIKYSVGNWNKKSSETLKYGFGTCTNKSNLLVSFFRAVGIISGYGVMKVDGKLYFGTVMLPEFAGWVSNKSTHIFTYVYLNDHWIKCDPSDDYDLCQNSSYFNYTTKLVDWDGYCNAILNLDKKHIFYESVPLSDIDSIMNKKPKNGKGFGVTIGNIYIHFLRTNRAVINNKEDLRIHFLSYLRKNYLFEYMMFMFFNIFKKK